MPVLCSLLILFQQLLAAASDFAPTSRPCSIEHSIDGDACSGVDIADGADFLQHATHYIVRKHNSGHFKEKMPRFPDMWPPVETWPQRTINSDGTLGSELCMGPRQCPFCWDRSYPSPSGHALYFLHISKVAGCSWAKDIAELIGREKLYTNESCYSDRSLPGIEDVFVSFREPRHHVIAMYNHCMDHGVDWSTAPFPGPVMNLTLDSWVSYWVNKVENGSAAANQQSGAPANCAEVPVNMQSQRMTCEGPFLEETSNLNDIDVQLAIDNMLEAEFVGILEAYQESICTFYARKFDTILEFCNCEDAAQWSQFNASHFGHNLHGDTISYDDVPQHILKKIDKLTTKDRLLYNAALKRFLNDTHHVQQQFGTRIVCQEALEKLRPLPPV